MKERPYWPISKYTACRRPVVGQKWGRCQFNARYYTFSDAKYLGLGFVVQTQSPEYPKNRKTKERYSWRPTNIGRDSEFLTNSRGYFKG